MPEGVPMTDQQPHPQRCETCVKYSVHTKTRIRFCDGIVIPGCGEDACAFEWVKTHGCASHCSASEPPEICCKCEDTPDVCGSDRIRCERAQAASEAREKVLDVIEKWSDNEVYGVDDEGYGATPVVPYLGLEHTIKSLREGAK